MEKSSILQLIHLRLLVGAAGELAPTPWWKTQFFTPAGFRQLNRMFPRSALRAAIESITLVAGREHDESVGARAVHLFRLPSHLEQTLADFLSEPDDMAKVVLPSGGLQEILIQLDGLAGTTSVGEASGPRNLGSSSRLPRTAAISELAAVYALALRQDFRVFPYYEVEEVP